MLKGRERIESVVNGHKEYIVEVCNPFERRTNNLNRKMMK